MSAPVSEKTGRALVEARGLAHVYEGGLRAVDGIDLTLSEGEIFGLLGPNGAGKTTFIRMLATLLPPSEGSLSVAGCDVVEDPNGVRANLGYVGQRVALDRFLTGRENLRLCAELHHVPRHEVGSRVQSVLDLVELSDRADDLAKSYSGGMQKRLDLACGLLHRPRLLILDEPTLGLDIQTRMRIWEYIRSLRDEGTTLLVTTHYLDEADQLCDRVGIIDHGRLQALGTPQQLKSEIQGDVVRIHPGAGHDGGALGADVREELDALPEVLDVFDGTPLEVLVEDGATGLPGIVDVLARHEVSLDRVAFSHPTLDDVFLKHTGRSMRE